MSWWPAYICATQGHIRQAVGTGTDFNSSVWSQYCSRCGVYIGSAIKQAPKPANQKNG